MGGTSGSREAATSHGRRAGRPERSEGIKRAWWSWISADQNDRISIFAPVGVYVGVQWMLAAFAGFSAVEPPRYGTSSHR